LRETKEDAGGDLSRGVMLLIHTALFGEEKSDKWETCRRDAKKKTSPAYLNQSEGATSLDLYPLVPARRKKEERKKN